VRSDDELLDLAIEVSLEWGPQMSRPVIDRIVERAPEVSRERAAELGKRYPRIASTVLDHIWYQGGYYAWHG
jgi:hypothetical protein